MKRKILNPDKIHPAVITVWAAIVASVHLIPTIPMIGGNFFTFASIITPLSGILFGPLAGALCSAAGGLIGSLIAPHSASFGIASFIPGTITAFTAGCIAWGRWPLLKINRVGSFVVNGGIIIYLIGIILWFSHETGRNFPIKIIIYYSIGLAALFIGSIFSKKMLPGKFHFLQFLICWLCALGGLVGGATMGNYLALALFKDIGWDFVLLIAPIERAIFAAGTALIGVPLLAGLNKVGIRLGPKPFKEDTPPPPAEKKAEDAQYTLLPAPAEDKPAG